MTKNSNKNEKKYSANEISVIFKFNQNTKSFLSFKYKDLIESKSEWEKIFKKDSLVYK